MIIDKEDVVPEDDSLVGYDRRTVRGSLHSRLDQHQDMRQYGL